METLFSWIHLSGMHVDCGDLDHDLDRRTLIDTLRRDVAEGMAQDRPRPDVILIAGNIGCWGDPQEWLTEFCTAAHLAPEAIFMVPGEHEITLSADQDRSVDRLVQAIQNGKPSIDTALAHEPDRKLLMQRQSEYLRWAERFGPAVLGKDRLYWVHRKAAKSIGVRLVGWNTALLAGGGDVRGKLRLGKAQRALIRPSDTADDLVVVLSHHPLRGGWMADEEDMDAWLCGHGDIHLSGAADARISEQVRRGSGERLVRISAGANHTYNVASVIRNKEGALVLRVWPRRWSKETGTFRNDVYHVPDGDAFAEYELRPPRSGGRPASHPKVWTSSLPSPAAVTLGRDGETHALQDHWEGRRTSIVAVTGWGGSGKSQLVTSWLAHSALSNHGAERVFGWSFYAQGTSPRAAVSSDEFFERAFSFFGSQPREKDAQGRAYELARLIRAQRTLLVLDGLEPFQDPTHGGVRDPALRYLLNDLVSGIDGMCVVTTRPLSPVFIERNEFLERTFKRIDLPPLLAEDGLVLLRARGVRGEDDDLRAAVAEYCGHALSLAILGSYLAEAWSGDIRQRARVGLTKDDVNDERRIRRVLASYDAHLHPLERQILRFVALFERPALMDYLHVLHRSNVLLGASDTVISMDESQWNRSILALRRADLLSAADGDRVLDAHPLVRAYFAQTFEMEDGDAFRAAHGLLFEHLGALAPPFPSTLEEMKHLYQAVAHGCRAKRWSEAFDILRDRIRQGEEHVSLKKLGAVSADLAAFACFFSATWEPVPELSSRQRSWLQNSAGVLLRVEGYLEDSRKLLAAAVVSAESDEQYAGASESARNLASTERAMGKLNDALATIKCAIKLADRSAELRARIVSRDFYAHLLSRRGLLQQSRIIFEEVDRLRETEDHTGALRDYPGASFVTLLIELGEPEKACQRAKRSLELTRETSSASQEYRSPLNVGLTERALARALGALGHEEEAGKLFDAAITHLQQAERRDHLAPGLVARAQFLLPHDPTGAKRDIEEALRIATPRGFRLVEADAFLTRGRLEISLGHSTDALGSLEKARGILEKTGFKLRMPRLLLAEALLQVSLGDSVAAERMLFEAKQQADEMGMRALDHEIAEALSRIRKADR